MGTRFSRAYIIWFSNIRLVSLSYVGNVFYYNLLTGFKRNIKFFTIATSDTSAVKCKVRLV